MIGKLHEQSREPCILPLQLDKIKFTKHHQVFYIQYFNLYSIQFFINRPDRQNPHALTIFQK